MASTTRLPLLLVASALVLATAAPLFSSENLRLFGTIPEDPYADRGYAAPEVVFNTELGDFLVVGREDAEAKVRRVAVGPNGEPRLQPIRSLGVRSVTGIAYAPDIGSYLLPTQTGYLRLHPDGRIRKYRDVGHYHSAADPISIPGARRWMVLHWDCKYGCTIASGEMVGPGLQQTKRFWNFPARAGLEQMVSEPGRDDLLMVWLEWVNRTRRKVVTYGQRFRLDGTLVGDRFEVNRRTYFFDCRGLHMAYNARRGEWLIAYRRGTRISGRLLRGDQLSPPFRISGPGNDASAPSVAYNPGGDSYLVTWLAKGDEPEIRGRWVRHDGRRIGKKVVIRDPEGPHVISPGYSACNEDRACLVVFGTNEFLGEIRGRLLVPPSLR